ncbi:CBP80/20-dependent translation initiation factor [Octopus bimaculoides]|nr:CBP80/20-dependent translation initiation factor [Octopus bimaculoides]|eukprot:XP_014776244.1 PREDICTED: CBP80/20-dependent translation initiation factor-like [Octopus bimaculoides]
MTTVKGETFRVLVNPIFQCLEMLLESATSDDLEILNNLLQSVGKQLDTDEPDKMQDLFNKIRLKIIQGSSPQVRCYLLEIIEIQAHNWKMLPSDITRFYCDTAADILAGMVV